MLHLIKSKPKYADILSISASTLCAVHCAAVPFLLAAGHLSSLSLLASPWFEACFIFISIWIGLSTIWPGYRKAHRKRTPLVLLLIGLSLISAGRWTATEGEMMEIAMTVSGATVIAISHLTNWRYHVLSSRKCTSAINNSFIKP